LSGKADRDFTSRTGGPFHGSAHEDLLVALRELTTRTSFDKIVRNEFEKIPSAAAKEAYLYVASVGQLDLAVRYETLVRAIHLRHDQLGPEILTPTQGILISGGGTGSSRHNASFRLRTRHPVIASIIFALAAPTDDDKFAVLNGLLSNLDPGFREDYRLLTEITRRREIVNTFSDPSKRRALYDRIATILPGNGYVFQHRSIIERELAQPDEAIRFARMAVKIDSKNLLFQNTLGLALEFAARDRDADGLKRQSLLAEADKLFEEGIRRDRTDAYGYIGKLNIIRQSVERSVSPSEKEEHILAALALLEEASEATQESPIIAVELARVKESTGSLDNALELVRRVAKKNPSDVRLKQLLIKFEVEKGETEEALKVAIEAAKADPTSWRIQRSLARLRKILNAPLESVRGHYEAAIRHHKGDVGLAVELAAYLFSRGAYEEARRVFETVRNLSLSGQERTRIREVWKDKDSNLKVFDGKVGRLAGGIGFIVAIPDNFEAFFWRTTGTSLLHEGDNVEFTVAFNAQGAVARSIRRVK
jgi:tetratricopeptide (TPR) repeat protein